MSDNDKQRVERSVVDAVIIIVPEETRLEDGTMLRHHRKDQCDGNCCLHGTSVHQQCKQPRVWRTLGRYIEHQCPCDIGHPCGCHIDYSGSDGVHGCCGIDGHCPAAARFLDVEEPEPEPIDPPTGLHLLVSAHNSLIHGLARDNSHCVQIQEKLTRRILNQAELMWRLERDVALFAFCCSASFVLSCVGIYLAVKP